MSKENQLTVDVYQNGGAAKYLETSKIHELLDVEKSNKKKAKLNNYIKESFSSLKEGSKILEIGSADGENAKFIESLGYQVTASDVADAFIEETKKKGLKTIKFNLLDDEFDDCYDGVFCWRVFVHFSAEDFVLSLNKVYNALNEGGILVFNLINRETKNVDSEMYDFQNEYKMGKERYYHYFTKEFVDSEAQKVGFEILSFHQEGGDNKNKWHVYVLKK